MMKVDSNAKKASLRAVVTRANGTVEDYGIIAYYHKNPVINMLMNRWIKVKEAMRMRRNK